MSAAGSLSITGAAALTALGNLAAAGLIAINGNASLTSNLVVSTEANSGGWFYDFDYHRRAREKRRRELEEIEEEQERIEDAVNREIARLLQIQERKDAERKDLERIKALVKRYPHVDTSEVNSDRVQQALQAAQQKQSRANLERLQREFERMVREEDDFLALVIALADE
jgi:hypothetical protein